MLNRPNSLKQQCLKFYYYSNLFVNIVFKVLITYCIYGYLAMRAAMAWWFENCFCDWKVVSVSRLPLDTRIYNWVHQG